jgi:hypothetical protein
MNEEDITQEIFARYDRIKEHWRVDLAEIIFDETKELAEEKAKNKLQFYHNSQSIIDRLQAELKAKEIRIKELESALNNFGNHLPKCAFYIRIAHGKNICTCGFDEVLKG